MLGILTELRDNPVERGSLVVQRLALLPNALLPSAKGPEVLNSLRNDVSIQTKGNPPCGKTY